MSTTPHPPLPSATPLYTVTVRLPYVAECPQCLDLAAQAFAAALHDRTVTSFTAAPGKAHNHNEVPPPLLAADAASAQPELPLAAGAASDTNGDEPLAVERALDASLESAAQNGFDPRGR